MTTPELEHLTSLQLQHNGDCSLIGVTPDLTIYAEEVYGEDGWLAQVAMTLDGTILDSIDEDFGAQTGLSPLPLPLKLVEPQRGWHTMVLNFTGARHFGLRGPERLDDLIRPFSLPEKIALINLLELDILPPMLLGLAESYVLAESPITPPNEFVVCRRVRVAYVLPEERQDETGTPYDYETLLFYVAHIFNRTAEQEPPLSDVLQGLAGVRIFRPMDCLITQGHLFVADGGDQYRNSAIHVMRVHDDEQRMTREEKLNKKLYG
jgi:hypothetical protein